MADKDKKTAAWMSMVALICGFLLFFPPLLIVQFVFAIIVLVKTTGMDLKWYKWLTLVPGPVGSFASYFVYADLKDFSTLKTQLILWGSLLIYVMFAGLMLYKFTPQGKALSKVSKVNSILGEVSNTTGINI